MSMSVLNIKSNHPGIRVRLGKEMSINKKVLHTLGDPDKLLFWWSESERALLIGIACDETPLTIKVNNRYYDTKTGLRIEKSNFVQTIIKIAGWRQDMIYTVMGEYISELNMVAFKLDDAECMEVSPKAKVDSDA